MTEAFQRVKQWGSELMDKPTQTPYFYNMMIRLVHSMLQQQHNLTVGYPGRVAISWS